MLFTLLVFQPILVDLALFALRVFLFTHPHHGIRTPMTFHGFITNKYERQSR